MAARAVSGFRSGSLDVFGASFDLGQLLGDASVGGGLSAEWAALGGVSHGPSASPPGDAPTPEPSAHQPSFGGGAGPAPDQGFLRCVDTSHDKTPCPWCAATRAVQAPFRHPTLPGARRRPRPTRS